MNGFWLTIGPYYNPVWDLMLLSRVFFGFSERGGVLKIRDAYFRDLIVRTLLFSFFLMAPDS